MSVVLASGLNVERVSPKPKVSETKAPEPEPQKAAPKPTNRKKRESNG